ncbi:hypothetical protein HNR46_003987 [Haloferula luteola]|uniref:DUF707 domain-containing protein n=1 Tax=Haloferula luteola TaxID=595692 RepID=A0A840V9H7_9BACT|nr:DUF707 domain-containing protein [Haloferula luteola]MBB5353726.1 hypothetical protein [Haloferula luteola]
MNPAPFQDDPDLRNTGDAESSAEIILRTGPELGATLEAFLSTGDPFFWLIDEQVYFEGDWNEFFESFSRCDVDLLATVVRRRSEEPDWHWWRSLKAPDDHSAADGVAAMLPLARLSRAAAEAVMEGLKNGWSGHHEAVVPTLVAGAGLQIEDIGGEGSFTPEGRSGCWYNADSWNWREPVKHVPGMMHHPVPCLAIQPARERLRRIPENFLPRILFASPVGANAQPLVEQALASFQAAGADCFLLQYDEADILFPNNPTTIKDRGYKWQLALRHLTPEKVANYDFIFYWDDDLDCTGFDPLRFVRIMTANRLSLAQPAIRSPHGLSHGITAWRACPLPRRFKDSDEPLPVVGRLTNFVEIMAPVFTRDAWTEFHSYLDEENGSGWGYDYVPLGRKGIVDALPVVHTRPVQSINSASEAELRRFLDTQGLFRYQPVEEGWLFDPMDT